MVDTRKTAPMLAFALATTAVSCAAFADGSEAETYGAHFQSTYVSQWHGTFPQRYAGPNSLLDERERKGSLTATAFLGARPWQGGEIYWNPEMAMGRGLSGVLGVAGFPNGEISRVSSANPTLYSARLFLRQTVAPGDGSECLESDQNQLAGCVDRSRLVLTAGKFSALDIFDDNEYSHEPRTRFMNWALMTNGAWDYPADARGYTNGVAAEYVFPGWALRAAALMEPHDANQLPLDNQVTRAHGEVVELERSHTLLNRPGKLRLMAFANRARMGSYRTATDDPAAGLDITRTRGYRTKRGWGVNLEQQFSDHAGGFLRAGWNDGATETWAFTEIDRTLSGGVLADGKAWRRPNDVFGIAGVINGLSRDHRDYLAAGGLGFIIGDGALNYGREEIAEAFYTFGITKWAGLSVDYQRIRNPAYNRDRGPVGIWSARAHIGF